MDQCDICEDWKEKKMLSVKDFEGGFSRQLAYCNRTFLRGYYFYMSGVKKFSVTKAGITWEFDTLAEAVQKFNEVSE